MKFLKLRSIGVIAMISVQIWFLFITFNYPYIGADLIKEGDRWFVYRSDPKVNSGLRVGDEVVMIDGMLTDRFSSVIRWRTIEQARTIQIVREGRELHVDLTQVNKFSRLDVVASIGQIFNFVIAAFLLKGRSYAQSGKHLSYVFLGIGITFMGLSASIRGDAIGKLIISIGVMSTPVLLLHFLIVFFWEKGRIRLPIRLVQWAYIVLGLIFSIQLLFFAKSEIAYFVYLYTYNMIIPFFIVAGILNLAVLFYIYLRYRKINRDITIIVKSVWIALFISFIPLACLSFLPQILIGRAWIDSFYTSWAVMFFPLSFTYLLATKKLYDIDLVVRRFFLTLMLAIPPSAAMSLVIAYLFPVEADFNHLTIAFVLCVILLSFTLYTFEYLTTKLERIIFPRKYHLNEALKKISRNLANISSFRELKDIILVDIIETLQIVGGAIVFRYQDSVEVISEGVIDAAEVEQLNESAIAMHPVYTIYAISRNEEYVCNLILSQKKTNTHFGYEELQWLNLITSYLSVSMENIYLIRKLTMRLEQLAAHLPQETQSSEIAWFRKLMFELQEKERVRIAADLHDTTLQDLFFLKRRCISLMEKELCKEEGHGLLNSIIEYIDVINMNLRQTCFELHPYLLQEIGLIRTVEKLIDLESTTAPFQIELQTEGIHLIEGCSLEMKRHLFRMIQELLNNAKKHAKPTRVGFGISAAEGRLKLWYEDDGVGFDLKNADKKGNGTNGLGLEYIKSRVLFLNGQYEFVTSKMNGLVFRAQFPLEERRAVS
jgi:two-component system sensor histidine kinase ComP